MLIKLIRALLVASIVVPVAAFCLFAWHSHTQIHAAAAERAERGAALVQEHTLKVIETIGLVLKAADNRLYGLSPDRISQSEDLWAELKALQSSAQQIGSVFVTDRNGVNLFTTRRFPSPPVDFSGRDYFHEQRERDAGFYVGEAYQGKISGEAIFNFSIRRTSLDGTFDGVVGVSAFVDYFQNFYRSLGGEQDDFAVALVRDDGSVLVRYPSAPESRKIARDHPLLQTFLSSGHGSFSARSPFGERLRLYGYEKVRGFPVYAVYGIDQGKITATWLATVLQAAMLTGVVMFFLVIAAWSALRGAKHERLALEDLHQTASKLQQEIAKRERAEASLMQAHRLEAVGQLTGGIAHDFNNLLTIITGNLALAERRTDLNAIRRMLESIRYATDRAAALTRQLLVFSRRNMLNPKTVSLRSVLERTRVLLDHALPDNVELRLSLTDDQCPARVDVSEFEAAVLNLVVNARDAMKDGGAVTVCLSEARALAGGDHSDCSMSDMIELRVEDTGAGMSTQTLARVYEPFFTTKEAGKGTGLGLSQVYGFTKQSGGSITINSSPGKGTQVVLLLPRSQESVSEETDSVSGIQKAGKPATVLVVEDDAEVRKASVAMLHDLGHSILIARNASEAMALLKVSKDIDILFSDVIMPGSANGAELAKQALELAPDLKILITTGYPGHIELLHKKFAVLPKPFTKRDLELSIDTLLQMQQAPGAATSGN